MDEFAQTREPDNLFEDDFTPIPHSGTPIVEAQSNQIQHGISIHSFVPEGSDVPNASTSEKTDSNTATRPISAVRGDRSATGGVSKPKLTETELSARLAAAKLNNARREEAHRLAEADEASFQKREAQASLKRREEGAARRAMEGEREKNRLRKLGAQGGREWDEGKEGQDASSSKVSQYRRSAYGGVVRRGGRQQDFYDTYKQGYQDSEGIEHVYVPRGGRGRGRGRGRGDRNRGDKGRMTDARDRSGHDRGQGSGEPLKYFAPPMLNAENEFPSLPSSAFPHRSDESQTGESKKVYDHTTASSQNQNNTDPAALDSSATAGFSTTEPPEPFAAVDSLSPLGEKQSWFEQVDDATGRW